MSWLGANEILYSKNIADYSSVTVGADANNARKVKKKYVSQETVEAALNRLNKAYAAAMECVGALHKADAHISKNSSKNDIFTSSVFDPMITKDEGNKVTNLNEEKSSHDAKQSYSNELIRISNASRSAFENAILLDPIISNQYSSTFQSTIFKLEEKYKTNYKSKTTKVTNDESVIEYEETIEKRKQRPIPVKFTSPGHKATVQQIAYLSLINYADLLLAGLLPISEENKTTILNRGVIKSLRSFQNPTSNPILSKSCWNRSINIITKSTTTKTITEQVSMINLKDNTDADNEGMDIESNKYVDSSRSMPLSESGHANEKTAPETLNQTFDKDTMRIETMISESLTTVEKVCDPLDVPNMKVNENTSIALDDVIKKSESKNHESDHLINDENKNKSLTPVTIMKSTYNRHVFNEPECDSVRLAIVAYIDAIAIDGSDPTVWVKLACAARRLGNIQYYECSNITAEETQILRINYRRLERHALERATSCLAFNEAPNRTASRALREWRNEELKLIEYSFVPKIQYTDGKKMNIPLSLFSWSNLGRILLRINKEGTSHSTSSSQVLWPKKKEDEYSFENFVSSTNVSLEITPLLSLPPLALSCVCSYLEPKQLWRFEVTSRAISAAITYARALLDSSSLKNSIFKDKPDDRLSVLVDTALSYSNRVSKVVPITEARAVQSIVGTDNGKNLYVTNRLASRVSNRVRSQIMASEKRAERSKRRQSIEFCLLAATLGCTADDSRYHQHVSRDSIKKQHIAGGDVKIQDTSKENPTQFISTQTLQDRSTNDKANLTSDSSLSSFLEKWRNRSVSSPIALLFSFIAHASVHLSDVFSGDAAEGIMMSACLLESFDVMAYRRQLNEKLIPSWQISADKIPKDSQLNRIELFALDLLHAELRLRRCELEDYTDTDFDSDSNFLTLIIPYLLNSMKEMEEHVITNNESLKCCFQLKVRCLWLASNYFIFRGKITSNVVESRESEKRGIFYIEEAMKCIGSVESIQTPHLSSQKRHGHHWKELSLSTMTAFSNEIQASSIVLQAQEQFFDSISKIEESESGTSLQFADIEALFTVGESLLERYSRSNNSSSTKHTELIDNFLSVHGPLLLSSASSPKSDQEALHLSFDRIIPVGNIENFHLSDSSNQSILTILIICLQAKECKYLEIIYIFTRLVISLIGLNDMLAGTNQDSIRESSLISLVEYQSDTDEDSYASEGETGNLDGIVHNQTKRNKLRQYSVFVYLLIGKINTVFRLNLNTVEKVAFMDSTEFTDMLDRVMILISNWFHLIGSTAYEGSLNDEDFDLFSVTKELIKSLLTTVDNDATPHSVAKKYFWGLVKILDRQRVVFDRFASTKPSIKGRSSRLRTSRRRADLVAEISCEIGILLSQYTISIVDGRMSRSPLLSDVAPSQLAIFIHNVLGFWRVVSTLDNNDAAFDKRAGDAVHLGAYLDRFGKERLRVPIATVIVALCGSAATSFRTFSRLNQDTTTTTDQISLAEFYDSDASAIDLIPDVKKDGSCDNLEREELLRVIMQAVHCVNDLLSHIPESEIVGFTFVRDYISPYGPMLPLVVTRILNLFSNCLLVDFDESTEQNAKSLWSPEYPYGTRTIGLLLDSVLHKAYKYLHGFSLANATSVDTKDIFANSTVSGCGKKNEFPPENVPAAAMLYRCIIRAYSAGRKSPPKAALDFVLDALPEVRETDKSKAIHHFLFSQTNFFQMKDLTAVIQQAANWEKNFSQVESILPAQIVQDEQMEPENESMIVRLGVSSLIAQGPLPHYQDSGDLNDSRSLCVLAEEELSKKFTAIIDDLRFSNVHNSEGWYKASQCLIMKAELIADRIGLSKGYTRSENFCIAEMRAPIMSSESKELAELEMKQEREAELRREGWVESLGNDMSLFIRYNWSSLNSLEALSAEVGEIQFNLLQLSKDDQTDDNDQMHRFHHLVWNEIDDLFAKNDIVGWQQAWGGIFVSSLRKVAYRCICISLAVAYKQDNETKNKLLISEIIESLGTMLYSDLMGSQAYGYPMHVVPTLLKREQFLTSLACFERAVEMTHELEKEKGDGRITWDLFFMMGKCHEKVAKTYSEEMFTSRSESPETEPQNQSRKYEYHMFHALHAYETSMLEAQEMEKNGNFSGDPDGGSNHGATEAVYRLHATRLKCLIAAVNHTADRESAEEEALRITECHWFSKPEDSSSSISVCDRVWVVLSDIVSALARCRLENPYFHRSIFRHAQALMWAPVLYDPVNGRSIGSFGTVPSTWAFKLRGLNYATNAASSAVVVIGNLFEKKRIQLCAVWVSESGSLSAFQTINSSIRKFNSLRGKYISAYIDSLQLCNRSKELEIFLRWVYISPRDLPAFFAASASALSNKPKHPHTQDCLIVESRSLTSLHFLTSIKRITNSALAAVILQETNDDSSPTDPTFIESKLKLAYSCFLRLNCDQKTLMKKYAWKNNRLCGVKDVVESLTGLYLKIFKVPAEDLRRCGWSRDSQLNVILLSVLQKCKELFPVLSGNYFSIQKTISSKTKTQETDLTTDSILEETKSYKVAIPDGLSEGDSFVVSVKVGETTKKIRLKVPAGDVSTIRFTLPTPNNLDERERVSKKRRIIEA